MDITADPFLKVMARIGATDLAFVQDASPMMQVDKIWRGLDVPPLPLTDIRRLAEEMFSFAQDGLAKSPRGVNSCTSSAAASGSRLATIRRQLHFSSFDYQRAPRHDLHTVSRPGALTCRLCGRSTN